MGVPLFAGSVNRQPSPKILSDWFQFYNEQRPHTAFDGRRPMEVYGGLELNNVANLSNQTGSPHMSQGNFFELDNEVWFDARICFPVTRIFNFLKVVV